MSESITVTGMVLSAMPVGDYDKRLVLLTTEKGKITAFARGARRPNSPLLAISNPFVFGTFTVYEGRNAYQLVQASVKNYFTELALEQPGIYYGFYFLELADYYGKENNDERQMLNLLFITLKALLHKKLDNRLVRYIFELKTLVLNGEYPQMFECVHCGKKEDFSVFSISKGGILCTDCKKESLDQVVLNDSVIYTIQYIITAPLEKLYTFQVSEEVLDDLARIMKRCMARFVDKKMRSLEILEQFPLHSQF